MSIHDAPAPPSIKEITELTRSELTSFKQDDPIRECGRAALSLLPSDADMCLQLAYQHLYSVPYQDVKTCWRRLYTDAALYKTVRIVEGCNDGVDIREDMEKKAESREGLKEEEDWITQVVQDLDMAMIMTGAPAREEIIELWFEALKGVLRVDNAFDKPPAKRRRLVGNDDRIPNVFPTIISNTPNLRHPIPRSRNLTLEAFQAMVSDPTAQNPLVIENAIQHWPALLERPWNDPSYLLSQTLGGRRLVPVEIGRSYTDQGWGQKILSFGQFMSKYMLQNAAITSQFNKLDEKNGSMKHDAKTGYLAQHDLFAQIPSLRSDISIPDYCFADPAARSTNPSRVKPVMKLEEPLLNAWFGPAGTISPLHTDPYHNILTQVVGYKYVRLYAPDQTDLLYPRSRDEMGIDMSNTSEVDLDLGMRIWEEISAWENDGAQAEKCDEDRMTGFEETFPLFREAEYVECVLGPGECLYIPLGWWHYVRSLTSSFSVSFWFN